MQEYRKQYREKNKDKIREKHREYREKNKDKIREKDREYNNKRYAISRYYWQEYYKKNKEKILKHGLTYRKEYKPIKNATRKIRYLEDLDYHIKERLRNRMYLALKQSNAIKHKCSMHYFGCTIEVLKQHIELQFKDGMTWDNWGLKTWHIDHIRPCASFDLTDPEQQRQCFHYTNFQPLWAIDNLRKSDKWEP